MWYSETMVEKETIYLKVTSADGLVYGDKFGPFRYHAHSFRNNIPVVLLIDQNDGQVVSMSPGAVRDLLEVYELRREVNHEYEPAGSMDVANGGELVCTVLSSEPNVIRVFSAERGDKFVLMRPKGAQVAQAVQE